MSGQRENKISAFTLTELLVVEDLAYLESRPSAASRKIVAVIEDR
jgi:hypothetical protein